MQRVQQGITTVSSASSGSGLGTPGSHIRFTVASTYTVIDLDDDQWPIGMSASYINTTADVVTFVAAAGVTINAKGLTMDGQWSAASLIKVAPSVYDLIGALTT